MKTCLKCGEDNISAFGVDNANHDRLKTHCRACISIDQKIYRSKHKKKHGEITGHRPQQDDIRGPHAAKIRQIYKTAGKLIGIGAVSRTFASIGAVWGSWR